MHILAVLMAIPSVILLGVALCLRLHKDSCYMSAMVVILTFQCQQLLQILNSLWLIY